MRTCFLCGRNGSADPLDKHHIFGGSYRAASERYGLVVDLCHDRCHENGEKAAHRCRETRETLCRYGQRKVMSEQGWTVEQFRYVFGRNWLEDGDIVSVGVALPAACGFRVIEDELPF